MEHVISMCPLSVDQMNVQQWFVKIVTAILQLEIQGLTDRQTGLHTHAKSLKVEQFEKGRIGFLKPLYEQKAPRTWTVLRQLLDVPPKSGKRRKADLSAGEVADHTNSTSDDDDAVDMAIDMNRESMVKSSAGERNGNALLDVVSCYYKRKRRKAHIYAKKGAVLISIMLHSSNEHCNAMQVKNAFYLAAGNASKTIHQWAAHIGIAVSPSSISNLQKSLRINQKMYNKTLGATKVINIAYNNCDFKFGVSQSTDLNEWTFESITTGVFLDMSTGILPKDLEYAEHIWEQHPNNKNSTNSLPRMNFYNIIPTQEVEDWIKQHCQWHIHAVLVEEYFPKLHSKLGELPSDFRLEPQKTSYSMAEAMDAKASTIDRNIEALTILLEQSGTSDAGIFMKCMILVHGDLGTLEKIEAIMKSHHIEKEVLERMHYFLSIPGLFHVCMACIHAINHIHASVQSRSTPNRLY